MNTTTTKEILVKVATMPAKRIAITAQKQRVSRRLLLTERAQHLTVNCPVSGVTSIIQIPAIPGYTLIWESPLASIDNCRGMVQQGFSYLRSLDTQILAGLLVVIADDYDLFHYQPSDSGAQKNALIRTAGKDIIINALLIIEDFVHTNNSLYLPKLSLKMDATMEASGIEVMMTEWLKTVAAYIMASKFKEEDTEDNFYNEVPKKTISVQYVKKEDKKAKAEAWATTNKKWNEQREFKDDIKSAKSILKSFHTDETVSPKLMGLLKSVFTEDALLTMDSSMRFLIAAKMEAFTSVAASKLVAILKKPYALLRNEMASLDSLEDETVDNDALEADDGLAPTDATETVEIEVISQEEIASINQAIAPAVIKPMSIIEQIKARKAEAARKLEEERKAKFAAFAALSTITATAE